MNNLLLKVYSSASSGTVRSYICEYRKTQFSIIFVRVFLMGMLFVFFPPAIFAQYSYNSYVPQISQNCENQFSMLNNTESGSPWSFGGWVEVGIHTNTHGYRTDYRKLEENPPVDAFGNGMIMENTRLSDPQMNQLWFYAEKRLDTKSGWDWGARADFMYGTDGIFLQSQGLESRYDRSDLQWKRWGSGDYFPAISQIYAETGYRNFSLKFGKVLTPMGHESVMSPSRFFYSTSYAYGIRPKTQTGAIVTWKMTPKFSLFGGWTSGEDRATKMEHPDFPLSGDTFYNSGNNAMMLGFNCALSSKFGIGYSTLIGTDKGYSPSLDRDYFIHSFLINIKPNRKWNYTMEWTIRNDNGDGYNSGNYGINQELTYRFNEKWSSGVRAEWMHTYKDGKSDDGFELTFGLNWTPVKRLKIRPEIRFDHWEKTKKFGGGTEKNKIGVGTSLIFTF